MTVLIPHIPVRKVELVRALDSIHSQTRPADAIHVAIDHRHEGSAVIRNRGLTAIATQWVAFLDDDDVFLAHHLDELVRCAEATEADIVYPGCHVQGGYDPHDRFGQPFDADLLRQKSYIPVTSLVRMDLVRELLDVHGEAFHPYGENGYDDWGFYLRCLDAGALFVHHPVKTWLWSHWGEGKPGLPGNTSGRGDRW